MSPVEKVGKLLPEPFRAAINRWCLKRAHQVVLDREMINSLAEFYNTELGYTESRLTYDEALSLCKVAVKINGDLWNILSPKTEEEIKHFYEVIPYYPFELAYWHMKRWQRAFRKEVVSAASGDVLDYGGGIGDLCVALARKGLDVTYGDVRGKNWKFAKMLFKKNDHNIKMIDLGSDKIPNSMMFDTIICIDTIEHVPSPDVVLGDIASHLRGGGKLIISALDCPGETEHNPMHLKMEFDAEELLNSLGIFKTDVEWLWVRSEKASQE